MKTGVPIFKLYRRSGTVCIYANGHVEGCEDLIGIANHIGNEISHEALVRYSKPLTFSAPTISVSSPDGAGQSVAESVLSSTSE